MEQTLRVFIAGLLWLTLAFGSRIWPISMRHFYLEHPYHAQYVGPTLSLAIRGILPRQCQPGFE
jgi:hypothetical protein